MGLKIHDVAMQTGLSIHTLRYYEQEGLIVPVTRQTNGHRTYSDDDVYRIRFITHLRAAGMPISQIKRYTDLAQQGDTTVSERLEILIAHQAAVEQKIAELNEHLMLIRNKITHYQETNREQLTRRNGKEKVK